MVPTALCQAVDLVAWHGTVVRKGLQYGLCVTVPKGRARRPPLCLQDCWRWCLTLLCGETMAFMSIEQHVAIDGMLDTERNVVLTITLAIMSAVRAPLRELCSSQDVTVLPAFAARSTPKSEFEGPSVARRRLHGICRTPVGKPLDGACKGL